MLKSHTHTHTHTHRYILRKWQVLVRIQKNLKAVHCWRECKMMYHYGKQYRGFSKKIKIELPYDPAISLLGIHPKELKEIGRASCRERV